jgi:hypothetical protein
MKRICERVLRKVLLFLMDREKLLWLLSNKQEKVLLGFAKENYLYEIGWTNSIITGSTVDKLGDPLPWLTYPFISFIAERLNFKQRIFEFGCGNSTLYYAKKVAKVDCVESSKDWYEYVTKESPDNVKITWCDFPGETYSRSAFINKEEYDIIIIDGKDRVNCCFNCLAALSAKGVIILDDAERSEYEDGIAFLSGEKFRRLDFWGTAPMINYLKCTTVFYRPANCLNI